MARTLEGNQRLIETLRLPIGLLLPPVARMTSQTIDQFVMAPVLRGLIGVRSSVAFTDAGRADESEVDGFVVRFIRTVLAIRQNRGAIGSALIGEINPLVGRNFKPPVKCCRPLNGADVPIVGR